ncbi:MAG: DMT family transporter [Sphingorhabdus sp.]
MRTSSGFTLALCGFALLTCGDAIIKSMAGMWPAPAIAALRFSIAVPLLAIFVGSTQGVQALRVARPWVQLGRGFSIAASSSLFFLSLFLLPLAEATAIVFISPILTALLSAVFLREHMQRAAWLATSIALAGVAMVLRPNIAEVGIVALLPLIAATFFSSMMIFNRLAAGTGSPMALQWILAAVAAPILLAVAFAGHLSGIDQFAVGWPHWSVVLRCAIVALTASTAHWLIYLGTTRGTAADAAQAVYIQLPVALLIDGLVFRHFPDALALGGSLLIVCAGLIMWQNQRRR